MLLGAPVSPNGVVSIAWSMPNAMRRGHDLTEAHAKFVSLLCAYSQSVATYFKCNILLLGYCLDVYTYTMARVLEPDLKRVASLLQLFEAGFVRSV